MSPPQEPGSTRRLFRPRHRLSGATNYQAAYCHGCKRSSGPLTVFVRPNGLDEHRLGLSVGRRVGPAVVRNRLKRLLREAFRLSRADLPVLAGGAFDLVVVVRPHHPLPLLSYQRLLGDLAARALRDLAAQESGGGDARA